MMGPMTTRTSISTIRRAHSVLASPAARRQRRDVAAWALANGHVLRRDALAALIGARMDRPDGGVPTQWTARDVAGVLCSGVEEWCSERSVVAPDDVPATLATYLRYLSAHRLFAQGSDDMATLRRAIAENRSGDRGSRDRHPAGFGRAPVLPIS
jgi:hypothetical protein